MMAYYDNLPSFKPVVDPQSFSGGSMSPEDRATMNMRMDAAVPDASPMQPKMPMGRFPANWTARPGIPTKQPAITSSFPVLNSRDTPPQIGVEPVAPSYPPPMGVMQPVDSTPSAVSRYAGDIASKTFLPYVQSAITNAQQGNYMRSAGAAAGGIKQAVWDAPAAVLGDVGGAFSSAANEVKAGYGGSSGPSFKDAFAKYGARTTSAAGAAPNVTQPATPNVAEPNTAPNAVQNGPKTATVQNGQQRLSELYPSYFKSPPKFGDAIGAGGNPFKMPLTTAEQNYNAQVQRGMELENRKRDLTNGLIYRATQLKDPYALAALKDVGGGQVVHTPVREETNPLYRYAVNGEKNGAEDKANMLDNRQEEIRQALFDPNPELPPDIRVQNARRKALAYQNALFAEGKKPPYEDVNDMIAAMTGTVWNGKYFVTQ